MWSQVRKIILIALFIFGFIEAQSFDDSLLQGYFGSHPNLLPVEGAELEANSQGLGTTRGMVFQSRDSVYLYSTGIGCPLCVGCKCLLTGEQRLAAIPIDPFYSALPLQKIARVWGTARSQTSEGRSLYFLIAQRNKLLLYSYQIAAPYLGSPPVFQSIDTISIVASPELNGRYALGIDTFYQASPSKLFQIRMFGQRGWIGSASYTAGSKMTIPQTGIPLLADSLDICSSGDGYFGTLNGNILDPGIGFANPIKAAYRPIAAISKRGALGDSGLFVLQEQGLWRTFKLGKGSLRNFSLVRVTQTSEGAWGTRGNFWDNRFQSAAYFVKDDSTVWSDVSTAMARTILSDSLRFFTNSPDSTRLSLFDADSNYSHPSISFARKGKEAVLLDKIWGRFSKGCKSESPQQDTITCLWPTSSPRVSLSWNSAGVHIRMDLKKGCWSFHLAPNLVFYTFDGDESFPVDTLIPWSAGDTLRIKFSNASYKLIYASPAAVTPQEKTISGLQLRVFGGEIHWSRIHSQPLHVRVSNLNGSHALQARMIPGSGSMRIPEKMKGIVFLSIIDPTTRKTLWRDFLFL